MFDGTARFHVSLSENCHGKPEDELRGCHASDAMFFEFDASSSGGLDPYNLKCTLHKFGGEVTQETSGGRLAEQIVADFDGELYRVRAGQARYAVSAEGPHREFGKEAGARQGTSSRSPPSKRKRRSGSAPFISFIFDDVTLNLFGNQSTDVKRVVEAMLEGGDGASRATAGQPQIAGNGHGARGEEAASMGASTEALWLKFYDDAATTCQRLAASKEGETLGDSLDALAGMLVETKARVEGLRARHGCDAHQAGEAAGAAGEDFGKDFERQYDECGAQRDSGKRKALIEDSVQKQKDAERLAYSKFIAKTMVV